jgi:hypothetical protein
MEAVFLCSSADTMPRIADVLPVPGGPCIINEVNKLQKAESNDTVIIRMSDKSNKVRHESEGKQHEIEGR